MHPVGTEAATEPGPGNLRRFLLRATDLAVAGLVLGAANELAHWRLGVREVGFILLAVGAWLSIAGLIRARRPAGAVMLEATGLGLSLVALNRLVLPHPLSWAALAYVVLLLGAAVGGWRLWRARSAAVAAEPLGEPARVLLLLAGAGAVVLPFFTDRLMGGVDARWYGFMLRDYIEQWRAAGPPVFIGQGEYAWNGGVHPFRSAPLVFAVSGVWDWLTCGGLETTALKHLALITSALAGTLGMYATGVALAPRRRWECAAVALLYVSSPGWLLLGIVSEAYMTYMTFAALPLVMYGNARLLLSGGARGGVPLAAGLALAWMGHPPVAMITMLVTLGLQATVLATGTFQWKPWRVVLGAGGLFLLLSAYYFTGMMELPRPAQSGNGHELEQIVGAVLVLAGAGSVLLSRRSWTWGLAALPGFALLWRASVPWFDWMLATVVLLAAAVGLRRRLRWFDPADFGPLVLLACLAVAAALTGAWLGPANPLHNDYLLAALNGNGSLTPGIFLPLSGDATLTTDFQPGPGLWLAGILGLVAAGRPRAYAAQCFAGATFLLVCFLARVPGVSDFLVAYFPVDYAVTSGILMFLRNLPVQCALLATGALLWLQAAPPEPAPWRRRAVLAVLFGAVAWAGHDALKVARRGWWATASRERTQWQFRPENAVLDRFVYHLLAHPSYFSDGQTDPRLELRLFDAAGRLLAGPGSIAREMELAGVERHRLAIPGRLRGSDWLDIEPGLVVQPGEHLLLRFEFDPARHYDGFLIIQSEHGYREYHLPESGLAHAFGTHPENSRLLSLWNSGDTPEHYTFSLPRQAGNDLDEHGGFFADLSVSHYDGKNTALRVESLDPWRATVRSATGGWLETPRVLIPGYRVQVDGKPVAEFGASPEGLLQVRLAPGEHTVQLTYAGTRAIWLAGLVSALAWLGVVGWAARRGFSGRGPDVGADAG